MEVASAGQNDCVTCIKVWHWGLPRLISLHDYCSCLLHVALDRTPRINTISIQLSRVRHIIQNFFFSLYRRSSSSCCDASCCNSTTIILGGVRRLESKWERPRKKWLVHMSVQCVSRAILILAVVIIIFSQENSRRQH